MSSPPLAVDRDTNASEQMQQQAAQAKSPDRLTRPKRALSRSAADGADGSGYLGDIDSPSKRTRPDPASATDAQPESGAADEALRSSQTDASIDFSAYPVRVPATPSDDNVFPVRVLATPTESDNNDNDELDDDESGDDDESDDDDEFEVSCGSDDEGSSDNESEGGEDSQSSIDDDTIEHSDGGEGSDGNDDVDDELAIFGEQPKAICGKHLVETQR